MRCYHLNNMYLSSIQQGIQSAHAQMELFVKYVDNSPQKEMLYDWGKNHKTMIVLNGGYLADMQEALEFFMHPENPYAFAEFYEGEDALGGIMTNIAIVLPEKIYKTSEFIRNRMVDELLVINNTLAPETFSKVSQILNSFGDFTPFEIQLTSYMNNFRLAS